MKKKISDIDTQSKIIIEKNADGIVVVDKKGFVRFVNPAAQLLFGRKAEEMTGELFGFPLLAGETTEVDIFRGEGANVATEMRSVEILWGGEDAYLISLRDVTDRKKAQEAIAEARANAERVKKLERDLNMLEQISGVHSTTVTARMFGLVPLREAGSEIFERLVGKFINLLDLSLEQKMYKVEHNISESLRLMAEEIGGLKAGPKDVIDIYSAALRKKKSDKLTSRKAMAYADEGKLMIIQLMGFLVSFYRKFS